MSHAPLHITNRSFTEADAWAKRTHERALELGNKVIRETENAVRQFGALQSTSSSLLDVLLGCRDKIGVNFDVLDEALEAADELIALVGEHGTIEARCDQHAACALKENLVQAIALVEPLRKLVPKGKK